LTGSAPPLRRGAEPRGSRGENADEWSEAATATEHDRAHGDSTLGSSPGTATFAHVLDPDDELATLDDPLGALDDHLAGERGAHADGGGRDLVGNLRACLETWKANTDDNFVLEVLQHGLKLPFLGGVAPRAPYRNPRNFVDEQDMQWVRQAVADLVDVGAVRSWATARGELEAMGYSARDEPFFVMPIGALEKSNSTPTDRRLRLIHDCREINSHLDLSNLGFELEQLVDFAKCLKRGDRLISTDLSSAYHHVGIHPAHWKYLGFQLDGVQYVYCVLPFGLSASPGTFCRFSAVAADMVRASGKASACIVYIDDFGFALDPSCTVDDAREIMNIIRSLGFSLNEQKTNLAMGTRIDLLGFSLDTDTWLFGVPERRLRKLENTAAEVLAAGQSVRARLLARLAGQILSMQTALGLVCRVRSRYIANCIRPAARVQQYSMIVAVSERARHEIELWARDLRALPLMPLTPHLRCPDFRLDADASATATAALFSNLSSGGEPELIHRELSEAERRKSSTLRELLGYAHAVRVIADRHGEQLRGQLVEVVGDSQAAAAIFRRGGSQRVDNDSGELELFEAFLDVLCTASEHRFDVTFRWVPREQLVEADALSKFVERHDFSLTAEAQALVGNELGPWDVDRFAAAHNAKAARFNSRFATAGAEATDAFSQSWVEGVSFVLHDFNQIDRVLDRVERDDAEAVIVVPEYVARPFWKRMHAGQWLQRVAHSLWLPAESVEPNAENAEHCFFGAGATGPFTRRLWALRTRRVGSAAGAPGGAAGGAALRESSVAEPGVTAAERRYHRRGGHQHRRRRRKHSPSDSHGRYAASGGSSGEPAAHGL
jgi:hypothetical protein